MSASSAEIGSRIREARKQKGLSQTELAQQLDKTMRTVQKYESGEIEPSFDMVNRIAGILEVTSSWLMGYDQSDKREYTLADIIAFVYDLSKKAGIRFEVDIDRRPHDSVWKCGLSFDGMNADAPLNQDICLFLESFRDQRERYETYWDTREVFDEWVDHRIAAQSKTVIEDAADEQLTLEERIRRRDAIVKAQIEQTKKKAAHKSGDDPDE